MAAIALVVRARNNCCAPTLSKFVESVCTGELHRGMGLYTLMCSVYYTKPKASFGKIYALLLDWPANGQLELTLPDVTALPAARLLGSNAKVNAAPRAGNVGLTVTLPLDVERKVLLQSAWAFELTGVQ